MKSLNWFTSLLMLLGIGTLLYAFLNIEIMRLDIFLYLILFIIILEIFPLKLPSGDDFEAGSIGILFVLFYYDFRYAVIALSIGLIFAFIKNYGSIKIPWFRVLANIGMYSLSLFAAYLCWNAAANLNIIIAVFITAFLYEFVNLLLLELIQSTVRNHEIFLNAKQQLIELMVPVFVYSLVIPTLLIQETVNEIIIIILYTLFFLLIAIFFSKEYLKQLSLRQSTSKAFIEILETSITPSLSGHGNRAAIICEIILEEIGYPKRKRHDLIQVAMIHDIGKILLPRYIFRKRGDMTLSEERDYRSHTEKGAEIIKAVFQNDSYSNWILYHHERWDGRGFPQGLKGEEIPYESRIIALVNELDHILARHDDPKTILKFLNEKSGTILDKKLVDKLNAVQLEFIFKSVQHLFVNDKSQYNKETTELHRKNYDSYSSIGDSFFIQTKDGKIITPGLFKNPLGYQFIQSLVEISYKKQETVHDTFIDNDKMMHFYVQKPTNNEVTIFCHNITPFIEYRNKLEQDTLESFVEIVHTLSNGKVILHTCKEKLNKEVGELQGYMPVHTTSDVPKSRELAKEILEKFPTEMAPMKIQLSISEAVTNTLKHATKGEVSIYSRNDMLQFLISDNGSGIPLHEIPKTILVAGYTSKRSLGQGLKLITNYSDGVQISLHPLEPQYY